MISTLMLWTGPILNISRESTIVIRLEDCDCLFQINHKYVNQPLSTSVSIEDLALMVI